MRDGEDLTRLDPCHRDVASGASEDQRSEDIETHRRKVMATARSQPNTKRYVDTDRRNESDRKETDHDLAHGINHAAVMTDDLARFVSFYSTCSKPKSSSKSQHQRSAT